MKIIEDKNNGILKRREVKVIVEAGKNPSMNEATLLLAEHFKAEQDNIAIKLVRGKFGRKTFLISAMIYHSKADKEGTEVKSKKQRDADKKEKETVKEEKKE